MHYRSILGRCLCALALLSALPLLSSCDRSSRLKPLSELKSDQAEAITKLIASQSMSVVKIKEERDFPTQPRSDVYYMMPNGVYIRVLKTGDMNRRAIVDKTRVSLYFKGYYFAKQTPKGADFDNYSTPALPPVEFLYTQFYSFGFVHFRLLPQTEHPISLESLMCEGLAYPMALLGDGAEVSLIIPFEAGPSGTYTQGVSLFVEKALYKFSK